MQAPSPPSRFPAQRMAVFYGALFALIGFHLPFWPVWLEARGLGPREIGLVLAAGVGIKVVINPLIAHMADRRGQRRPIIMALAAGAFIAFALYPFTQGLWPILAVTVLFFAFWSPMMPLAESLAVLAGREAKFDYGPVRAWGSMTFIAAAVGGGYLFAGYAPDAIFWVILATAALVVGASASLPGTTAPKATGGGFQPLVVLREPGFVLFIVAAGLIHSAHSVYYGFGTLNWLGAGYSEDVIGWLWAEGVLAEIVLFAFGARLIRRFGAARLIAAGGLAGAVRWAVTGTTDAIEVLVVVQALHAFSFGATHLGAIYFIARRVPAELSASAQSLYSAVVMGLAMSLAALASGWLYARYGGGAYHPMAAMSALGFAAAVFLIRRP